MRFDHERLDVYRLALEFVAIANDLVESFPHGRAYLPDQLQRAATSVPLNVAEGAGEHSKRDKARFYRMARRSATECAAILDRSERSTQGRPRAPPAYCLHAHGHDEEEGKAGHGHGHGGADRTRA